MLILMIGALLMIGVRCDYVVSTETEEGGVGSAEITRRMSGGIVGNSDVVSRGSDETEEALFTGE